MKQSNVDKLCCLALAGLLVGTSLVSDALDSQAEQAWEQAHRPAVSAPVTRDLSPWLEAVRRPFAGLYRADVPLSPELQAVLWASCEAHGVPLPLALGLIEVESNFQPDAVSSEGSYGLCQLNPRYFPDNLTPAKNITAGVAYLGVLLECCGDTEAALTCYNAGHDHGGRDYARAVLAASEKWGWG